MALGLHGQLSLSKFSWLLNTRALIGKTKDKTTTIKKQPQPPNHDSTNWEEKNQNRFWIWCIVRFIIHEWGINEISLGSLNKKVFISNMS